MIASRGEGVTDLLAAGKQSVDRKRLKINEGEFDRSVPIAGENRIGSCVLEVFALA